MTSTMQCDMVSAEAEIFSGEVQRMTVMGSQGELGIYPHHAPLLTALKPGVVRLIDKEGHEKVFYVSGGMLEIVPSGVTVLADTVQRAQDLDAAKASQAVKASQQALANAGKDNQQYSQVLADLASATAQLRAIEMMKELRKH